MPIRWGEEVLSAYTSFEVRGLREVQRKMIQVVSDLTGPRMIRGMRDVTLKIQRDAMINAPVDTGRLRASITPSVKGNGREVMGVVGSNVKYAPYMELGTGMHSERAMMGAGGSHFPPPKALETWARRHGLNAFAVAWSIYKKGGLRPRKFLETAFKDNLAYAKRKLGQVVGEIVRK